MPRNAAGVPIDPTEWNRNDGFSPGSAIITVVPGLDLERTGAAPETDIGRSLHANAPIVLLDATSGRRVPYWAEIDQSAPAADQRALVVRPAVNFREGHHIIVALRRLQDSSGATIQPGDAFRSYRDSAETSDSAIEARRPHMEELLKTLGGTGVKRADLFVAWDFTIASQRSLSERMLHIRDDAFRSLGSKAPAFQVTQVENDVDERVARRVTGTFTVPNYLTGDGSPGNTFNTGENGLPERNGDYTAAFTCIIPRAALKPDGSVARARPAVYGHGLLGSEREVAAGNVRDMANEHDFVFCATRWIGLSEEDIANAVSVLGDLSRFPSIADRLQQGILDTLFLGRLMIAGDGLASNPAFQSQGMPVIDTRELFFDGNSEGGIVGGAATAVAQDWTRAAIGVPAMNYSTLLQRSTDWDTYKAIFDPAYPDPTDHVLTIGIVQMLWDRGEADGYAWHINGNPLPATPPHHVILDMAFGDHQVTNWATMVEARTLGASMRVPGLDPGRSPEVQPFYGIPPIRSYPFDGSLFEVWDVGPLRTVNGATKGTPPPPTANVPNREGVDPHGPDASEQPSARTQISNFEYCESSRVGTSLKLSVAFKAGNVAPRDGEDPHGDPRRSKEAREQKSEFLKRHGRVVDVCGGRPCTAPARP